MRQKERRRRATTRARRLLLPDTGSHAVRQRRYRANTNAGVGPAFTSDRIISGGRSAGSQVACRTARSLGAHAVLALAYPVLGPGSPAELLATGVPTLVVQGGSDPFGRPEQFPPLPAGIELVAIPSANHMFATGPLRQQADPLTEITDAVIDWLNRRLSA